MRLGLPREDPVSQLSHADYLSEELAMAGAAPRLGLQYGQDRIAFSASTSQIPSGKSRTAVLATASASRVLPTPPALTSETTRCASTNQPAQRYWVRYGGGVPLWFVQHNQV